MTQATWAMGAQRRGKPLVLAITRGTLVRCESVKLMATEEEKRKRRSSLRTNPKMPTSKKNQENREEKEKRLLTLQGKLLHRRKPG